MIENVESSRIASDIRWISGFKSRYHRSKEAREFHEQLKVKWEGLTKDRNDVKLEYFHHMSFPNMPSLMLSIQGQELPEEIIIIGGHGDSLALRTNINGSRQIAEFAPGADDNASGIAVITEILRVLTANNYRPKRTLMFISYAIEEIGLVGSQEIAAFFLSQSFIFINQRILGVLNFDMTNFQGPSGLDFVIIGDYTNMEQNQFLEALAKTYIPEASWEYDVCGHRCSDHAPWHSMGFRASYLFESRFKESNPYIHTINDTIEKSNGHADHAVDFAKMGLAFFVELDR